MRESGWLIEAYAKSVTGAPQWLRLFAYYEHPVKPEWTEDPNIALRFAREVDAAWVAMLYPEMCCLARITEHIWLDGKVTTPAERTEEWSEDEATNLHRRQHHTERTEEQG